MREHPIPQDIVGYRFHIIGSMTLKQFAELAAGVILALIIYATNLPDFIKWPLIFTSAMLGTAAAFLPVAEQPLDHWLTAFFKALYKPTKYFWEKSSNVPPLFKFELGQNISFDEELDLAPYRRQRIKDYIASVELHRDETDLDQAERQRISQVLTAFEEIEPAEIKTTKLQQKPQLKVTPRSLIRDLALENEAAANRETPQQKAVDAKLLAQDLEVPEAKVVVQEKEVTETEDVEESPQSQAAYVENQAPDQATSADQRQQTVFNAALPFPSKPSEPNKLVGMILTPNQELIPDAIVEISDEQERVVRAVKSNALGQFFIKTPLRDGTYSLRVEHDQYRFPTQELSLKHEAVEPIEIRSLG